MIKKNILIACCVLIGCLSLIIGIGDVALADGYKCDSGITAPNAFSSNHPARLACMGLTNGIAEKVSSWISDSTDPSKFSIEEFPESGKKTIYIHSVAVNNPNNNLWKTGSDIYTANVKFTSVKINGTDSGSIGNWLSLPGTGGSTVKRTWPTSESYKNSWKDNGYDIDSNDNPKIENMISAGSFRSESTTCGNDRWSYDGNCNLGNYKALTLDVDKLKVYLEGKCSGEKCTISVNYTYCAIGSIYFGSCGNNSLTFTIENPNIDEEKPETATVNFATDSHTVSATNGQFNGRTETLSSGDSSDIYILPIDKSSTTIAFSHKLKTSGLNDVHSILETAQKKYEGHNAKYDISYTNNNLQISLNQGETKHICQTVSYNTLFTYNFTAVYRNNSYERYKDMTGPNISGNGSSKKCITVYREKLIEFNYTSSVYDVSGATYKDSKKVWVLPKETYNTTVTFTHREYNPSSDYVIDSDSSKDNITTPTSSFIKPDGNKVTIEQLPNGQTTEVCQSRKFKPKSVIEQYDRSYRTEKAQGESDKACAKIYREAYAEFSTKTRLETTDRATNANYSIEKESDGSAAVNDRIYADSTKNSNPIELKFTHFVTRENKSYDSNVSALELAWKLSTGVDGRTSISKGQTIQANTNTYKIYNSEYTGSGANDKISLGTYRKEVCQRITAKHAVTIGLNATQTWSSDDVYSEACANVYRPFNFKLSLSDLTSSISSNTIRIGEENNLSVKVKNTINSGIEKQEGTHSASPKVKISFYAYGVSEDIEDSDLANYLDGSSPIYSSSKEQVISPNDDVAIIQSGTFTLGLDKIGNSDKICYRATINYESSSINSINLDKTDNYYGYNLAPSTIPIKTEALCKNVHHPITFQVWGGSVFGTGTISTIASDRNDDTQSWVDYGLISNAGISGVSSAASNGWNGKKMTISNESGELGYANIPNPANTGKQFIQYFLDTANLSNNYSSGKVNLSSVYEAFCPASIPLDSNGSCSSDKYRITKLNSGAEIEANPLQSGITHIIYAKGNITITSNLLYQSRPYTTARSIPQYIIYSTGNIYINPNVTEVNAILVSDKTIYTCDSSISSECKNNQLVINGAIFAKKLVLTRSYHANNEPAERIVFPVATSLWAKSQSENSSRVTTTYIRELAPRF